MTATTRQGVVVAHLIETDGPGGAERVVVYLVSQLAARGIQNVVLVPADGEGWLGAQLPRDRVDLVPVPLRGVSLFTSFRAVRGALRARRPTLAHSHEFTMGVLGGVASWSLRVPHVLTMHGGRYYATRTDRRLALSWSARRSAAVVAVSRTVAAQLTDDLRPRPRRIEVIPNGIPPVAADPATLREELGLPPDARLIVTVGNLYAVKGHADLLRALARLSHALPWPVHLAIAGRGPEEDGLRQLATSLGLGARVHLLGLRADVPGILRTADVFALPSHSEALPLALLEAMRTGLPIVATAVGDVPHALAQGNAGVLVAPRDIPALTDALRRLLTEPAVARSLADQAQSVAADTYDIARMVDRYLSLYQSILPGGARLAGT